MDFTHPICQKIEEDRCWHGKLKRGIKKLHYQCFIIKRDAGDIIGKHLICIKKTDYINDVLDKVDLATLKLLNKYFKNYFRLILKKQNKITVKPLIEN